MTWELDKEEKLPLQEKAIVLSMLWTVEAPNDLPRVREKAAPEHGWHLSRDLARNTGISQTAVSKPTERLVAKKLLICELKGTENKRGRHCTYKAWKLSDSKEAFLWLWRYCIREKEHRRFMLSPYFVRNVRTATELLVNFTRDLGFVEETPETKLYRETSHNPFETPGYREREDDMLAEQHKYLVFALPGLFEAYHSDKKVFDEDRKQILNLIPDGEDAFRFLQLLGTFLQAMEVRNVYTRDGFGSAWWKFTWQFEKKGRFKMYEAIEKEGLIRDSPGKIVRKGGVNWRKVPIDNDTYYIEPTNLNPKEGVKRKKRKTEAQGRNKRR